MNKNIILLSHVIAAFFVHNCGLHVDSAFGSQRSTIGRPGRPPAVIFIASDLEGKVDEAMQYAKKGIIGYIIYLSSANKKHPEEFLSYIEKYVEDPSDDIRFSVVTAASQFSTKKAMQILAKMSIDNDVGNDAVKAIYNGYSREQIISSGSGKLRSLLIRNFIKNRYPSHVSLLLVMFENKASTASLLRRKVVSYRGEGHSIEKVCLQLALSELGDIRERSKVVEYFSKKRVENILIIMNYLKFVDDKTILSRIVDLLNDKENASRVGIPGGRPEYTRLCDHAMIALQSKFFPSKTHIILSPRRFSDLELAAAYRKYKALINN